jgi:hypothetical protein
VLVRWLDLAVVVAQVQKLETTVVAQVQKLETTVVVQGRKLETTVVAQGRKLETTVVVQGRKLEATVVVQGRKLETMAVMAEASDVEAVVVVAGPKAELFARAQRPAREPATNLDPHCPEMKCQTGHCLGNAAQLVMWVERSAAKKVMLCPPLAATEAAQTLGLCWAKNALAQSRSGARLADVPAAVACRFLLQPRTPQLPGPSHQSPAVDARLSLRWNVVAAKVVTVMQVHLVRANVVNMAQANRGPVNLVQVNLVQVSMV